MIISIFSSFLKVSTILLVPSVEPASTVLFLVSIFFDKDHKHRFSDKLY